MDKLAALRKKNEEYLEQAELEKSLDYYKLKYDILSQFNNMFAFICKDDELMLNDKYFEFVHHFHNLNDKVREFIKLSTWK